MPKLEIFFKAGIILAGSFGFTTPFLFGLTVSTVLLVIEPAWLARIIGSIPVRNKVWMVVSQIGGVTGMIISCSGVQLMQLREV